MNKVNQFINDNEGFFSQPIIKRFFQEKYHQDLLVKVVEEADSVANEELNNLFKYFFLKYRIYKYIDVLAHNYSIYFDKKRRKHAERFSLQLDKSITENEESGNFIDFIESNELGPLEEIIEKSGNISELIEDEKLRHAFEKLSNKQQNILELSIVKGWSNKEIAFIFNNTPQNISKLKRNAIKHLRKEFGGENYE